MQHTRFEYNHTLLTQNIIPMEKIRKLKTYHNVTESVLLVASLLIAALWKKVISALKPMPQKSA